VIFEAVTIPHLDACAPIGITGCHRDVRIWSVAALAVVRLESAESRLRPAIQRVNAGLVHQALQLASHPLPRRWIREVDRTAAAFPPGHNERRAAVGLAHKKPLIGAVVVVGGLGEILARNVFVV